MALVACAGCDDNAGSAAVDIPPVSVRVFTVALAPIDFEFELPGRIEPQRTAEIRARVDGIVEKLLYTEGTDVEAGTPLFQIDASDYKAQLAQAEAALQRAQAVQRNAASVTERFRPLVKRQAVSAQEYDAALSALGQAQANVADARAAVTLARLRLERCTVRAPIAGRVGRALVTEGALVSAASATLLAQINQLSPISATFTKSSTAVMDLTASVQAGVLATPDSGRFPVRITLPNGREYAEQGFVDFADLAVDRTTGAQTVRAQFENTDRALLPGQFVRGTFHVGVRQDGILIPARAVQLNNGLASVLMLEAGNTVAPRQVTLGEQRGGRWSVLEGLKPGERVVVDGWHKVRPGQRVTPVEQAAGEQEAAS
ncbi:efflux RND transporter periplasmic adaptor subunit [Bordetella petrii]|uniref:efflux RND transporter periplasmic adaptor subunit n=1 Tax=Bordetella petrii TaxID=94624 RepID=UPI001E56BAD3|nr:efflux RND transporter periplasmic adaptor subunit [Bordetella petrii]MCD0503371.1 efflux RND transporter periplasmic adaptor subunit [Bordetella petrii]